jgi:hypothetical protein
MELSFWANVVLGAVVVVCGAMSSINLYFAIPATLAGIILLWGNIKTHRTEKADFRKKIVHEALDILNLLVSDTNCRHIDYNIWSGKAKGFKVDVLGHQDYGLWNAFYESVGEWNEHFRSIRGVGKWEDFVKFNDQCVISFFKVYDGISWVRESEEAKARITDFLSRAERTAGFSGNLRSV